MKQKTKQKLSVILTSFIGMGVFIVLFIVGLIFLSYLLIIGGIIGLILFSIAYLRAKFFAHNIKKQIKGTQAKQHHRKGRTIDHE